MAKLSAPCAGVYRRCSKDRNDQASVSEQEELGLARCDAEGWEARLYLDNDLSASRYATKDRDDWPRLLADLRAGQLAVVWLWESSRGDRKLYEWIGFLELCREHGVRIYVETHEQLYNLRNHRHMKTLADEGVHNAYASDETSLRVQRDLAAAARKGLPHGPADYGYIRRYDPVTRAYITQEPDPETGPVAAGIITRAARNDPVSAIARDLTDRGIPAPKGGAKWSRQTVREIALNPEYTGCRRLKDGTFAPGWVDGTFTTSWVPVIDIETHMAAVKVLNDPARIRQRPGRQERLLSYLAACGPCGEPLAGGKDYAGRPQYRCRVNGCIHVGMEWLDELVTLAVLDALADPSAAALYRGDDDEAGRHRADAARLRAELDEWAAADITPRAYQIREATLLPRIRNAERAADAADVPLVLRELLTAGNLRAGWDHLEVAARRAIIRALMGITVAKAADRTRAARTDPARVTIGWKRDGS